MDRSALVRDLVLDLLGEDLRSGAAPVAVRLPDGSLLGSPDAAATLVVRSDDALRHIARAPGELGFARAYVSGALDLEGDLWAVLALRDRIPEVGLTPAQVARLVKDLGFDALRNPPPVPPEEIRVGSTWRAHARDRDATAISHHYDVSNDFYRLVLGPSMTYSCAVFEHEHDGLARAQANKHELICRKLALRPGQRLLDVGCGWGGVLIHAARNYGVRGVGVTLSEEQAEYARAAIREAGLSDSLEVRVQDYREVSDGPYDKVVSVGMYEHVGASQLDRYMEITRDLVRPGGLALHHGICQIHRDEDMPNTFIQRYVFPDGELHPVNQVIAALERSGQALRDAESMREHYALTLRHWVANLYARRDEAITEVGEERERVWRLYMAASALAFERGDVSIFQLLAAVPGDRHQLELARPQYVADDLESATIEPA